MGITRGTPLVANVAAAIKLTTQQDLGNLEDDGELSLVHALTTASDWVYDRLLKRGDPTTLTNATAFERAVAWYFMSLLAESGSIGEPGEKIELAQHYLARAEKELEDVWPRFASTDDPRSANEVLPAVKNLSTSPLFGTL